jgi:hypothetical protein
MSSYRSTPRAKEARNFRRDMRDDFVTKEKNFPDRFGSVGDNRGVAIHFPDQAVTNDRHRCVRIYRVIALGGEDWIGTNEPPVIVADDAFAERSRAS